MWPLLFVFVVSLFNIYMGFVNPHLRYLMPLWCLNAIIVMGCIARWVCINVYGIDI